MDSVWVVFVIAIGYLAALAVISFVVRRSSRTSASYTTGGKAFPAVFIGLLLASEFIGTSASMGTAQEAFSVGISASWNLVSLGVGFILFSFLLARKFKTLGENTISGALARAYGERVRVATSVIMIAALLIVTIAIYASGGAVLASLLEIDPAVAVVVTGALAAIYVAVGGMRSVVYTNLLHAIVMFIGIVISAVVATKNVGGFGELRAKLPAEMFDWDGVGWAQIMAWMIAGIGATFATQYVVQAVISVGDEGKAQRAGFFSAIMLVPYGVLAALVGMCSAVLYPKIESIQAMPAVVVDMNAVAGGIVIAGLAAAMLGSLAALILGASTLMLKDFYQRFFNRDGDDKKNVRFIRVATIVAGMLPIPLALYATDVLTVTFLAKSLRAALAVLVLMMFYAPRFGSRGGAFASIIASLLTTIAWFLAGDPYGIDNAYIAVLTPLVIMTISHFVSKDRANDVRAKVEEPA
ncbi:MAG: sodium:solute symporter family protein [Streptosporangiales bacterium]|nr:sodium:solute symporter family protein [Streptosporangiales bacterium]